MCKFNSERLEMYNNTGKFFFPFKSLLPFSEISFHEINYTHIHLCGSWNSNNFTWIYFRCSQTDIHVFLWFCGDRRNYNNLVTEIRIFLKSETTLNNHLDAAAPQTFFKMLFLRQLVFGAYSEKNLWGGLLWVVAALHV